MPKRDKDFHDYVMNEVFEGTNGISSKGMFGGWGIYKDGVFFALIAEGVLYFKVDETNRKDFERLGSRPFTYFKRGKEITMSYWELPAEIMEDKSELPKWIQQSVWVSLKNKQK